MLKHGIVLVTVVVVFVVVVGVAVAAAGRCRCRLSVVPEATLLLRHIVQKMRALAARLDAAPETGIRWCRAAAIRCRRLALAVLEAARIPANAHFQRTQARRPQSIHITASRRCAQRKRQHGRFQAGER